LKNRKDLSLFEEKDQSHEISSLDLQDEGNFQPQIVRGETQQ
jgi:hypothetical protein